MATPSPLSRLLTRLSVSVRSILPPAILARWDGLPPASQQIVLFTTVGIVVFGIVWIIIASLMTPQMAVVSARELQMPSYNQGVRTAVTPKKTNFPDQPATATTAAMPSAQAPQTTVNLTPLQQSQLLELRRNVDTYYKSTLSFTINEAKMIAFAQAATKIDMVNAKWDTLIAGAATDDLATEYLTSATLENTRVLSQTVGLTVAEYNDIYALSSRDATFNKIANAYKSLVSQGVWGPVTPLQEAAPATVDPALRFPVSPAAAPAASGIAPAPAGSPAPPYSPPPSR